MTTARPDVPPDLLTQWDGLPQEREQSGYHWLQHAFQRSGPHPMFWDAYRQQWKGENEGRIVWVDPSMWAGLCNYYGPAKCS